MEVSFLYVCEKKLTTGGFKISDFVGTYGQLDIWKSQIFGYLV